MSTTTSTIPTAESGPAPTDVQVQIPVENVTITDIFGVEFQVERVQMWAFCRSDGYPIVTLTAFGKGTHARIWSNYERSPFPAWAPAAPTWFAQVVADMQAKHTTPKATAVFPCGPADGGAA